MILRDVVVLVVQGSVCSPFKDPSLNPNGVNSFYCIKLLENNEGYFYLKKCFAILSFMLSIWPSFWD